MANQKEYTAEELEEIERLNRELAGRFVTDSPERDSDDLEELRWLKEVADLDDALDDFLACEVQSFEEVALQTRAQVIERTQQALTGLREEAKSPDRKRSEAFYTEADRLLVRFLEQLRCVPFIEPLPDWWFYTVEITKEGASLYLAHCEWEADSTTSFSSRNDLCFTMLHVSGAVPMTKKDSFRELLGGEYFGFVYSSNYI